MTDILDILTTSCSKWSCPDFTNSDMLIKLPVLCSVSACIFSVLRA